MQTVPVSRSSQSPQSKPSTLSFRCLVIFDMLVFVPNTLRRVGESSSPVKTSETGCSPTWTGLLALKPLTRNTYRKFGLAIKRMRIKKTTCPDKEWLTLLPGMTESKGRSRQRGTRRFPPSSLRNSSRDQRQETPNQDCNAQTAVVPSEVVQPVWRAPR